MHDPFPIAAPAWQIKAVTPLANYLHLPILPFHIHEILGLAYFYYFIQTRVSPWLSPKLAPKSYARLSVSGKINWDVHVVSLFQAVFVSAVASYVVIYDDVRAKMTAEERVFGYTGATGLIEAMSLAYFVWDMYITTKHFSMFGIGMLFHALSAFTVFSFGFRPFVNYWSPVFILYELSTPFLNVHWFCDKLDMTGSTLQMVNGMFLLVTFTGCRLISGTWASICVFRDLYTVRQPIANRSTSDNMRYAGDRVAPTWLCLIYLVSNIVMNILNWYWITKMVETIRKRFDPPLGTKQPEDKPREKVEVANGVRSNGHTGVQIHATEVKQRPTVQRQLTELPVV